MGISRIAPRLLILSLTFLLAGSIAASSAAQTAPRGDVFNSNGGGNAPSGDQLRGIIISITPNGINTYDVKLQDPVTHYIHSVTVEADVVQGLKPGERVTQYKDPDTGETLLAPTILVKPGESVPGQANDTGSGSNPPSGGNNNGGVPIYPGGFGDNGGVPTYPGGANYGGGVPSYPAPKMMGNLTGSGYVNGIPVDIGGGGPNTIPIPAGAPVGTQITASNRTGQGNWKMFRGTLMTDAGGYYVQFTQGYFQGNFNGQYMNGWLPIQAQTIRLRAS